MPHMKKMGNSFGNPFDNNNYRQQSTHSLHTPRTVYVGVYNAKTIKAFKSFCYTSRTIGVACNRKYFMYGIVW